MKNEDITKILNVGIMLSSERDLNKLLDKILSSVMDIANCDGGTLYLLNNDKLYFTIMRNHTMNVYKGGDGKLPQIPPVDINSKSLCAISLLSGKTINISDVYDCDEYDLTGPKEYDGINNYHTKSLIAVPMINREGDKLGVLQLVNAKAKNGNICAFGDEIMLVLESVASQAALAIQNVKYIKEIKNLFDSFVKAFVSAIEERSPYNGNHTKHMVEYGDKFIDWLNKNVDNIYFDEEHKKEFLMSVWLHDVGKLVIPLEVMDKNKRLTPEQHVEFNHRMEVIELIGMVHKVSPMYFDFDSLKNDIEAAKTLVESANKAGFVTDDKIDELRKLTEKTYINLNNETHPWLTQDEFEMLSIRKGTLSTEERDVMQSHASMTDKLLSQIEFTDDFSHVRDWASSHHEFLSGEGYPHHLSKKDIPKEVRMLTILDIFEALTAKDRPYKKGMPVEKALMILKDMAEKEGKLDKSLVDDFTKSKCWESEIQ